MIKSIKNYKSLVDKLCKYFFALHLIISSVSFIFALTSQMCNIVSVNASLYYPHTKLNFFPEKKIELISYLVTIPILFFLFIAFLLFFTKYKSVQKNITLSFNIKETLIFLAIDVIGLIGISIKTGVGTYYVFLIGGIWALLFLAPFVFYFFRDSIKKTLIFICCFSKKFKKKIFYILLILVSLFSLFNLYYLYKPFVLDDLYIFGEMWAIPEMMKIDSPELKSESADYHSNKTQKYIDTIEFAEKKGLYGPRKLYDIRNPEKKLTGATCTVVDSARIKNLLNSSIDNYYIKNGYRPSYEPLIQNYFYLEAGNQICSIKNLSNSEIDFFAVGVDELNWNDFQKILKQNKEITGSNVHNEEKIKKLNDLYHKHFRSTTIGWFHHHNHILSSISQIRLQAPPDKIFSQYGYGTSCVLNFLMEKWRGFNIGDYSRILNSFYYIYYIFFFLVLFLLFRSPFISISIWVLSVVFLNKYGYYFFYIGPGINPIRHFFDVFVIAFFYLYLKNRNRLYLLLILISCIAGIFLYPTFGLFLTLAISASFLMLQFIKRSKSEFFYSLFLLLVGGISYKLFSIGPDFATSQFFDGINGFLATKKELYAIYIFLILIYGTIIKTLKSQNPYLPLLIFLTFYSQGTLLYYLTISEFTHFGVFAPWFVLTIFVWLQVVKDFIPISAPKLQWVYLIIFLISSLSLVVSFPKAVEKTQKMVTERKYYKEYKWEIPASNFSSSMNPLYFADSIDLLKNEKFSNKNKIYLISEYDKILPILSNKYNAFSSIDLEWYLTPKLYEEIKAQILKEKPRYIFVDRFLTKGKVESLLLSSPSGEYLFSMYLLKYHRMRVLESIVNEIRMYYQPIAYSKLLTVFELVEQY